MTPDAQHADPRYQDLDEVMRRYHRQADSLIEVLHRAQGLFGHLAPAVMTYVAAGLAVPLSRVYGVATFYHFFSLAPKGAHTVTVCTGTACYVKRAEEILAAVERATGVAAGRVRPDGSMSVEAVRCLGPCSQAPVVVFDDEVTGALSAAQVVERLRPWVGHDA